MKRQYKSKTCGLEFSATRIPDGEPNKISIRVADGGEILITGPDRFVSTVLRQLLEHPESLIAEDLLAGYSELPASQQKKFRKEFKIGEFADPNETTWPAWI